MIISDFLRALALQEDEQLDDANENCDVCAGEGELICSACNGLSATCRQCDDRNMEPCECRGA